MFLRCFFKLEPGGGFKGGGGTRGSCPSLDELKQVWRPFFGNCAPHLKNENQMKKFLRPIG